MTEKTINNPYIYKVWSGCNQQIGDDPFSSEHGATRSLKDDVKNGWEPYQITTCPGGYNNQFTEITIMLRKANG